MYSAQEPGVSVVGEVVGAVGAAVGEPVGDVGAAVGEVVGDVGAAVGVVVGDVGAEVGMVVGDVGEAVAAKVSQPFCGYCHWQLIRKQSAERGYALFHIDDTR